MCKMTDEQSLIAGMEAIPQDMTARLVYADWLEENGREDEAKFLRLVEMTGEEFGKSIIGQKDDEDYHENGWVAIKVRRGNTNYGLLSSYGHCSCYDTWASLCGGGIYDYYPPEQIMQPNFDWVGTWEGLLQLAKSKTNPLGPRDGGKWLAETYEQVLAN